MKKNLLYAGICVFNLLASLTQSTAQQKLIHYWHFNNLVNFTTVAVNPSLLPAIKADYSTLDTSRVRMAYVPLAGTVGNAKTYWDNLNPGDTINARMGQPAGLGFRPRNPSDSMQLQFYIPTTGYQNISIKFEVQKSSTGNGAPALLYDYSVDSGVTWKNTGLSLTLDSTQGAVIATVVQWKGMSTVSINNDVLAYNNSRLVFRIRFSGPTNIGTSGNVRFDNITFEGDTFIVVPPGPPFYNLSQITHTNAVSGNPDSLNVRATISGTVYGFNQRSSGVEFLLRDNTGGITVFHSSKNFGYTVAEGDSLWLIGTVATSRGLEEFIPDTIVKSGSGKTLKAPTTLTQLTEANENDLVKMNNLMFYTTPSGSVWPVSANILCHTQGLTDTVIINVLATSALAGTPLPTAALFNATGMLQQFSTSSSAPFAFNGYQILPRNNADILSGLAPPDAIISLSATANLTSLSFSWTKPSTYVDANMTTLVFIKQGSVITTGNPNKNATAYTANADFTASGTSYQNDALAKCVMNSDNNSIMVTGLNQANTYYALVYVVRNNDSAYSAASTANKTTTNNNPAPVTGLSVSGVTPTSAKISWTKPAIYDNAAHSTLVFVKADNAITSGTPSNAVSSYTANTVYGSGTAYQNDAGAFCVFNSDTNSVTITNLIQGKTYNVMIWVVRDADSKYATASTIGSGSPLPPPPLVKLIHYWHFNNLPSALSGPVVANTFKNWGTAADYSSLDTAKAKIYYRTFNGTSNAYMTFFDNVGGDTVNSRMNTAAGNAFRARNPSDSMQLYFYIPTSHYKNIKISYACEKSSYHAGQFQQNYDYSIDAGTTWKTSGLNITFDSIFGLTPDTITSIYTPIYISFPNDTMAYNNPNLIFRIKFSGNKYNGLGQPSGASGNNRFDNFAVEGDTTTVPPLPVFTAISEIINVNSFILYPNPANDEITISSQTEGHKTVTIYNITGQVLYESAFSGMETSVNINHLNNAIYFIRVVETKDGKYTVLKLVKN